MPEWLLEAGTIIAAGVGVYAAIRSDLAYMRAKIEHIELSAAEAHRRLDMVIYRRNGG